MTEEEAVRRLAAIKNLAGEHPTYEVIVELVVRMKADVLDCVDRVILGDIAQLCAQLLDIKAHQSSLELWRELEAAIDELYSELFLATDTPSVSIHDVARNLLAITSTITASSTGEALANAGSKVIGQTIANPGIDIDEYRELYPVLYDIDDAARHLAEKDGIDEPYFRDGWDELVRGIQKLNQQLDDR